MRPTELDQRCAEMKTRMAAKPERAVTPTAKVRRQPKPKPAPTPPANDIMVVHPLVKNTRLGLSRETMGSDGLMNLANAPRLDLVVSTVCAERALTFTNALLTRLAQSGIRASVGRTAADKGWATWVYIDADRIRIRVREIVDRVEREPTAAEKKRLAQNPDAYWYRMSDLKPSGRLALVVLSGNHEAKRWADAVGKPVELQIEKIIGGLRRMMDTEKACRLEREARQQMQAAEEIQQRRAEIARRDLKQRTEELLQDVDRWHQSERIRAYLSAFRERMEKWGGPIDTNSETAKWLEWANRYADRLDPLNPMVE